MKMKYWFLVTTVLLLNASLVQSAPWGFIAINDDLKECKYFWAGDEFEHYGLPSDWKPYYNYTSPILDYEYVLRRDIEYQKILCNALNYTFKEPSDLSSATSVHIFLFLNNQTKECKVFILDNIYSTEGKEEYENLKNQGWYKDLDKDQSNKIDNYTSSTYISNREYSKICSKIGYNYTGKLTGELITSKRDTESSYDYPLSFLFTNPAILFVITILIFLLVIYKFLKDRKK